MKRYIVCREPLFLKSGMLELSGLQASRRRKGLMPCIKKGEFEVIGEVCFKIGEKIGIDSKTARRIEKTGAIE